MTRRPTAMRIDRWIDRLATLSAMLGGAALLAVMTVTVVSVTGRGLISLGLGPIPGDFELAEAGTAFAIFAFLPLCQRRGGHARVALLFRAPRYERLRAWLDAVANILMAAVAALILWRLTLGAADKLHYGETSFILQFPLWWAYAAALFGATVFVIVAAWSAWMSLSAAVRSTSGTTG